MGAVQCSGNDITVPLKSCTLPQLGEAVFLGGMGEVRRAIFSPGRVTLGVKAIPLCPAKNCSWQEHTILTRFRSGHFQTLTFSDGNKVFPTCLRCSVSQASPEHILDCLGLSKQDLYEDPLMVLDFLRVNEIRLGLAWLDMEMSNNNNII
ncbi:uncharacterized protein TNCV_1898381 [Trichonephila clavipes]|uniref:Uncharacterized protein n=1 Tax=Trichonephila clavipes TaxID=2585209 RepID=A0A8X6WG57_TRICX|nr:uncharacterized protein TNCV_1898381 [Trichonephila clavipes]